MKSMSQLIVGGLTVLGVGAVGYKAYKLKKLNDAVKEQNIIEIEVESKDETRK